MIGKTQGSIPDIQKLYKYMRIPEIGFLVSLRDGLGAQASHTLSCYLLHKSAKSYCRSDSRWGAYTSGCCGTSPRALDQHPSRFPATAPHFRAVGAQPCAEALNICSFASRLLICCLAEQIRYIREQEFLMLQTSTLLWNITQKGLPAT